MNTRSLRCLETSESTQLRGARPRRAMEQSTSPGPIQRANGINESQQNCLQELTYLLLYENTKRKLYSCIANIYFNRQCLQKRLISHYANIKIPNNSPAAKFTQRKVQTLKIKGKRAEICRHPNNKVNTYNRLCFDSIKFLLSFEAFSVIESGTYSYL